MSCGASALGLIAEWRTNQYTHAGSAARPNGCEREGRRERSQAFEATGSGLMSFREMTGPIRSRLLLLAGSGRVE